MGSKLFRHKFSDILGFVEGTLKWFIDDMYLTSLYVQNVKMVTYWKRIMYGAYMDLFIAQPARRVGWPYSRR